MKRYDRATTAGMVAGEIGHFPGELGDKPLSAAQRTALKYFCRRWLAMSRADVQGPLAAMRAAYDSEKARAVMLEGEEGTHPTDEDEPAAPVETPAAPVGNDPAGALAAAIRAVAAGALDESAVRRIAAEEAAKVAPRETVTRHLIAIQPADGPAVELPDEPRHAAFRDVLACVATGVNVLLVGPAGCGKTHLCEQVAKALSRPFRFTGAVSSEYKLTGFIDAQGRTVRTPFRDAFEHGGVFLWDELDASAPAAMLAFNGALANGAHDFPDALVPRHADFAAIASANTYGHGADRVYVGRNQMDAASLDRFATVAMDYDEELETQLFGATEWTAFVHKARRAVRALNLRHVVSMRAIQQGAALLRAGMDRATVESLTLWKHLAPADVAKVRANMEG